MHNTATEEKTVLRFRGEFSLGKTLTCGQVFRFTELTGADDVCDPEAVYELQAGGRTVRLSQPEPDIMIAENCDDGDFWRKYFGLDEDYGAYDGEILHSDMQIVSDAVNAGRGIRILRQDRWEALCSFIVSQNNNIPRIKKIISRLSERFGERTETPFGTRYAFPTPEALAKADRRDIFACGTGFRDKYISDAAQRVCKGLDLDRISALSNGDLQKELLSVCGVGPKVAACVMLYAYGRGASVPRDVWIKRTERKYGIDICSFGENSGLLQQYMFYYERNVVERKKS